LPVTNFNLSYLPSVSQTRLFKDEAWPGHRNGREPVVWGLDGLDNPYVVLEERGVIFDARFWMVCITDVSF